MKFILPMPPSINQTYGINNKSVMYKRTVVKDWEEAAGYAILQQWKAPRIVCEFNMKVEITWYFKTKRDIDSGIKILLDLLQKQGIYKNDSQIVDMVMKKVLNFDEKNPRVEVDIYEIG